MDIGQKKRGSVTWKKANGDPGRVDGVPAWTNSNATAYQMDIAADGQSALFTKLALGDTDVAVTGDADLGSGVTPVTASGKLMDNGAVTGDLVFTDE